MKPQTILDCILFQLTPTRTRCELYVIAGDVSEKLTSGLLAPFLSHLRSVEEQLDVGGCSIKLVPPDDQKNIWFTKGTAERFVRFVSTPEILERANDVALEMVQLEETVQMQNLHLLRVDDMLSVFSSSNSSSGDASLGLERPASPFKARQTSFDSSDSIIDKNSKKQLMKALEARKSVLQKEQGMVFARAVAAGFDLANLMDLIVFSNCFGAGRLREACFKFVALCIKWKIAGFHVENIQSLASRVGFTHLWASIMEMVPFIDRMECGQRNGVVNHVTSNGFDKSCIHDEQGITSVKLHDDSLPFNQEVYNLFGQGASQLYCQPPSVTLHDIRENERNYWAMVESLGADNAGIIGDYRAHRSSKIQSISHTPEWANSHVFTRHWSSDTNYIIKSSCYDSDHLDSNMVNHIVESELICGDQSHTPATTRLNDTNHVIMAKPYGINHMDQSMVENMHGNQIIDKEGCYNGKVSAATTCNFTVLPDRIGCMRELAFEGDVSIPYIQVAQQPVRCSDDSFFLHEESQKLQIASCTQKGLHRDDTYDFISKEVGESDEMVQNQQEHEDPLVVSSSERPTHLNLNTADIDISLFESACKIPPNGSNQSLQPPQLPPLRKCAKGCLDQYNAKIQVNVKRESKSKEVKLKSMQDSSQMRRAVRENVCGPKKLGMLAEAKLRAEKLRAYKASLQKAKQEKEEGEQKRIMELKLRRQERIAECSKASTFYKVSIAGPTPLPKRIKGSPGSVPHKGMLNSRESNVSRIYRKSSLNSPKALGRHLTQSIPIANESKKRLGSVVTTTGVGGTRQAENKKSSLSQVPPPDKAQRKPRVSVVSTKGSRGSLTAENKKSCNSKVPAIGEAQRKPWSYAAIRKGTGQNLEPGNKRYLSSKVSNLQKTQRKSWGSAGTARGRQCNLESKSKKPSNNSSCGEARTHQVPMPKKGDLKTRNISTARVKSSNRNTVSQGNGANFKLSNDTVRRTLNKNMRPVATPVKSQVTEMKVPILKRNLSQLDGKGKTEWPVVTDHIEKAKWNGSIAVNGTKNEEKERMLHVHAQGVAHPILAKTINGCEESDCRTTDTKETQKPACTMTLLMEASSGEPSALAVDHEETFPTKSVPSTYVWGMKSNCDSRSSCLDPRLWLFERVATLNDHMKP